MKLCHGQFCGVLLNKREIRNLILTEYTYPAGLKLSRHEHEYAYISLVLDGSYDETFDSKSRRCKSSTVTLHPPGEQHSDDFHRTGGRIFSVEIEPQWMQRAREFPVLLGEPAEFHGGASAALVSKIYREFYQPDKVSHLAIEGLLFELIAEISRRRAVRSAERRPPRWLESARELIHEHFAENLTLELIARQVDVHPVHLVREFRKHFRLTIGDYIRQRRIEHARRRLSESDIPLIEIALGAGFSQQSHFSRTFKAVTGMTPTEYRRSAHLAER